MDFSRAEPDEGGAATPRRAPRRYARLPSFALYGDAGAAPPLLHVEPIHSRSQLYGWEIDAHVHAGLHQLLWLRQGTVEAMLDETRASAGGPLAVVMPPGVAHAFRFSRGCDGYVLTFNATALAEGDAGFTGTALQSLFAAPRVLALDAASPEAARLQPLFEAMHAEHLAAHESATPVPGWLTRAIVWRLAEAVQRDAQHAARRGGRAQLSLYTRWVVLLEAHYHEGWPVTRYAATLGLTPERLNRMVRAETGHTAQALLHARLVREACRRLVHVAVPVGKLAFELGFEDAAYFCRFFKRHTGLSPRAYRARAQQPEG